MKKLILTIYIFTCTLLSLYAQSAMEKAEAEFRAGNYGAAVAICEMAVSMMDDSDPGKASAESLLGRAESCRDLSRQAAGKYAAREYQAALELYTSLLKINPDDALAKERAGQCRKSTRIALDRSRENERWKQTVDNMSIESLKKFLAEFPSGIHRQEAASFLKEYELWNSLNSEGTEEAYRKYLETSGKLLFKDRAVKAILRCEDIRRWKNAKELDTEEGYEEYLVKVQARYLGSNVYKGQSVQPLYAKEARGRINLLKARKLYGEGSIIESRLYFDLAEGFYSDSETKAMAAKAREEDDFQKFTQAPDIDAGTLFLRKYNGQHNNTVRDILGRLYCDQGDFDKAKQLAWNPETLKYISAKEKEYRKTHGKTWRAATRPSGRKYSSGTRTKSGARKTRPARHWSGPQIPDHFFQADLGYSYEFWPGTNGHCLPVELRLGNAHQVFNLFIGEHFNLYSGKKDNPNITFTQFATAVNTRFNIVQTGQLGALFIGAGGSYNINTNSRIKDVPTCEYDPYVLQDLKVDGIVNRSNWTGIGTIGFGGQMYEISLHVKYDLTPVYNIEALKTPISYEYRYRTTDPAVEKASIFYDEFESVRKMADSRLRIGLTLKINLFGDY